MINNELYTCPCCGYKTLEELPRTFEICPICYWEDDNVQFNAPYYEGGANEVSLYQAQMNFIEYGASDKLFVDSVRKPNLEDERDIHFQLIVPKVF